MKNTLGALLGAGLLFTASAARAQDDDVPPPQEKNYGLLQLGLHVEGGLGIYQVLGGTGLIPGIYPKAALELELGNVFAIPIVGRFNTSLDEGSPDLSEITVSAGVLFRMRKKDFPLAGAFGLGLRFGYFSARPEFIGIENTDDATGLEINGFPITPEATIKGEVWIGTIVALKVGITYAPIFIGGTVLHSLEESLAVALVL